MPCQQVSVQYRLRRNPWLRLSRPSQRTIAAAAQYSRRTVTTQVPVAVAGAYGALAAAAPAWARGGQQDVAAGMQRFQAGDVSGSIAFFDRCGPVCASFMDVIT